MEPDLIKNDLLLFSAKVCLPGNNSFKTLFYTRIESNEIEQLTIYPEFIESIDNGKKIQIRNRFGVFRTDESFSKFDVVKGLPSFVENSPIQSGKLNGMATSPDGSYFVFFNPTSYGYGQLILFDLKKNSKVIISSGVKQSIENFPAIWSPDSRFFVYESHGVIYYYSIDQYKGNRVLEEGLRAVTQGRIECVTWGLDTSLLFIKDRSLYKIRSSEFFTQALYSGIISIGTMIGTIPFSFDPNFDFYRISPDGKKMLFCKDGRNLFLYILDPDDYGQPSLVSSLPYLFLQGDTRIQEIIWPKSDQITVFTQTLKNGDRIAGAYRIDVSDSTTDTRLSQVFKELDVKDAHTLVPSPDMSMIAIVNENEIIIRDYFNWSKKTNLPAKNILNVLWLDSSRLIIAGRETIELKSLDGKSGRILCLSQVETATWSSSSEDTIVAKIAEKNFERKDGIWKIADTWRGRTTMTSSDNYRIYLDSFSSGSYQNMIMIRSVKGLGTKPLVIPPIKIYQPFPEKEEISDKSIFEHGSRIRRREVAIVFNCYDTVEGLSNVLNTLADYKIITTFFVNGEFIRRAPGATRLISESGHEVGNMFFTTFDPTDARFRVDENFIKNGLAKTEDEYYSATEKELSLLWHTPFYTINTAILEASAAMNYIYIGRDVDPLDWVSVLEGKSIPGSYFSANDLIERIMSLKKPGSIIPVRIGIPQGGRDDYLFMNLDLLINSLMDEGYEIVPISTLIEHAK